MVLTLGQATLNGLRGDKDGGSYAVERVAQIVSSQDTDTDGTLSPPGGWYPGGCRVGLQSCSRGDDTRWD